MSNSEPEHKSKVQSPVSVLRGLKEDSETVRSCGENLLSTTPDIGSETSDAGLRVADLRKSFSSPSGDTIEVLCGVSFAARPGETVAITGVSGSGKSTLLNLLGGLEKPDHGSVSLGRFEIDRAQAEALAKFRSSHVGFIFQFHHLLADLSAAENIALPLMIARKSRRQAIDAAVHALEQAGLGARAAYPVGHLSGGEQQRVAACRALITEPCLVLADEPTGNLDASYAEELGEILASYARRRRSIVILATHNERLAQLCDRTLVLRAGRVSDLV